MNEPEVTGAHYLLVGAALGQPVDGDRAGWTLSGYREGVRCWSTNLARHGAHAGTTPGTAQAVADRLLAAQGITTGRWDTVHPSGDPADQDADPRTFCARGHDARACWRRRPGRRGH